VVLAFLARLATLPLLALASMAKLAFFFLIRVIIVSSVCHLYDDDDQSPDLEAALGMLQNYAAAKVLSSSVFFAFSSRGGGHFSQIIEESVVAVVVVDVTERLMLYKRPNILFSFVGQILAQTRIMPFRTTDGGTVS